VIDAGLVVGVLGARREGLGASVAPALPHRTQVLTRGPALGRGLCEFHLCLGLGDPVAAAGERALGVSQMLRGQLQFLGALRQAVLDLVPECARVRVGRPGPHHLVLGELDRCCRLSEGVRVRSGDRRGREQRRRERGQSQEGEEAA
jgi:hypothetical protein